MDDLFHRNSSKHVAEYFVVVGMKFENLWQACVDLSRASPELTDPCSSPSEHSINLNLDILQTAFEASVLSRYPTTDHPFSSGPASLSYASRLPEGIEFFCFPQGLLFSTTPSFPKFHAFVHTSEDGSRMIGTCLYFSEELSTEEYDIVNKINSSMHHNELSGLMEFGTDSTKLYVLKGICILSYWPFIEPFKKFLMILYNMLGSDKANKIPIERYICNFIDDIPAPPAGKVDIVYYLNDDIIRFRCPPLNVPSTWLGFPLLPLFHCLSLHNILLLFSCVLTERQVLLISSQYSLLTICAESIMSLLYPLTWSHAYIPILPSRLLGVLGAPFPFLLGLPSAIYEANKSCVSNETIRVHLDQDSIDLGSLGPPPPLPEHRKQKLMTHLENTIPWYHPNVTSNMEIKKIYFKKTREKIRAYDDVHLDQSSHDLEREGSGKSTGKPFQVQSDKESTTSIASKGNVYTTYMPTKGVHNSYFGAGIISAGHGGSGKAAQSSVAQHVNVDLDDLEISETSIREGFLKFFINMLKDYKRYLVYGSEDLDPQKKFNYMDFMNAQQSDWHPLLRELMNAQCFSQFVDERVMLTKLNRDVVFFDEAIDAKLNRYTFKLRELDTPFLLCNFTEHVKSYVPPTPSQVDLSEAGYAYPRFPVLQEELYVSPRNVGAKFAPATDQLLGMLSRLRLKRKKVVKNNTVASGGNKDSSVDAAVISQLSTVSCIFSCYLVILSQLISTSIELTTAINNRNSIFSTKYMLDIYGTADSSSENNSFVRRMSISDIKETASPFASQGSAHSNSRHNSVIASQIRVNNNGVVKAYDPKATEMFASAGVALQVCFEVLNSLIKLDYGPDEIVYRYLAEACADLGDADRLLDLVVFMDSEGLLPDHQIRHSLVRALINLSHRNNIANVSSTAAVSSPLRLQPSEAWNYTSWENLRRPESTSTVLTREHNKTMDGKDINSGSFLTKVLFNIIDNSSSNTTQNNANAAKLPLKVSHPPIAPNRKSVDNGKSVSIVPSGDISSPRSEPGGQCPNVMRDRWSEDINEGYVPCMSWNFLDGSIAQRNGEEGHVGKVGNNVAHFAVSKRLLRLVGVSERRLSHVFPDLCIDFSNKFGMLCPNPHCSTRSQKIGEEEGKLLTIGEVYRGWIRGSQSNNSMNNYTTQCIYCGTAFIPRFSVTYHSQPNSPNTNVLWCEFLSPWTLYKEVLNITFEEGVLTLLSSDFLHRSYQSAVVYWNLLVSFRLRGLPIAFLCGKTSLLEAFPAASKEKDPGNSLPTPTAGKGPVVK